MSISSQYTFITFHLIFESQICGWTFTTVLLFFSAALLRLVALNNTVYYLTALQTNIRCGQSCVPPVWLVQISFTWSEDSVPTFLLVFPACRACTLCGSSLLCHLWPIPKGMWEGWVTWVMQVDLSISGSSPCHTCRALWPWGHMFTGYLWSGLCYADHTCWSELWFYKKYLKVYCKL